MSTTAFCTACGAPLPAGGPLGGPCPSCGATVTPAPTLTPVDPVESLRDA